MEWWPTFLCSLNPLKYAQELFTDQQNCFFFRWKGSSLEHFWLFLWKILQSQIEDTRNKQMLEQNASFRLDNSKRNDKSFRAQRPQNHPYRMYERMSILSHLLFPLVDAFIHDQWDEYMRTCSTHTHSYTTGMYMHAVDYTARRWREYARVCMCGICAQQARESDDDGPGRTYKIVDKCVCSRWRIYTLIGHVFPFCCLLIGWRARLRRSKGMSSKTYTVP